MIVVPALEPDGHPLLAFQIPYHDSEWFEYGFTLLNDAPFPVTVYQIGQQREGEPTRPVSVSISEQADAFGPHPPENLIPFRVFTIPSHGATFVLVRERFVGCSVGRPGQAVMRATQLVRFRMRFGPLTVHRSDYLPLPHSIRVSGNQGCPG